MGLEPGDKVELVPKGGQEVTLRKRRVVELGELFGSLPTDGVSLTLEGIDEVIGDCVRPAVRPLAAVIGIDSDVLLRLLLDDDADQARRARALVVAAAEARESTYISLAVLCETVWVLGRGYRHDRPQIARAVELLLAAPALQLEDSDAVEEALAAFRAGPFGFADALIGVLDRRAGCRTTYTFDRRAAATADFTAVG